MAVGTDLFLVVAAGQEGRKDRKDKKPSVLRHVRDLPDAEGHAELDLGKGLLELPQGAQASEARRLARAPPPPAKPRASRGKMAVVKNLLARSEGRSRFRRGKNMAGNEGMNHVGILE